MIYIAGAFNAKNGWELTKNVMAAKEVAMQLAELRVPFYMPHMECFDRTVDEDYWMMNCLAHLEYCSAVVLTRRWQRSSGTWRECKEMALKDGPVFRDVDSLIKAPDYMCYHNSVYPTTFRRDVLEAELIEQYADHPMMINHLLGGKR